MTDTLRDKLIHKGWVTEFNANTLVRLIEEHYAELAKPVAVTGQPSDEELNRLWFEADGRAVLGAKEYARAVLARWGTPNLAETRRSLGDGEVARCLADSLKAFLLTQDLAHYPADHWSRRAAELLERQAALVPVSVSERLPGPEDCDAEGRCWWWYPSVPDKTYGYWAHEDDAIPERAIDEQPTHWLPNHALPLPEAE